MARPMSAAEYRAHAEKSREQSPTQLVTLKSGSVFELRRPDLLGYIATGRLPQSLVQLGMQAWKNQGKVETQEAKTLDDNDVMDSLVFAREIVHDCTVNPKFVEFATADNEIGASDMLPADFWEIYNWAMNHAGVAGVDGLQSFREGQQRRTARSKSRRKKLQPETVSVAEH